MTHLQIDKREKEIYSHIILIKFMNETPIQNYNNNKKDFDKIWQHIKQTIFVLIVVQVL